MVINVNKMFKGPDYMANSARVKIPARLTRLRFPGSASRRNLLKKAFWITWITAKAKLEIEIRYIIKL